MKQRASKLAILVMIVATLVTAQAAYAQLSIIDLGTLGGSQNRTTAINEREQVVGSSYLASGEWHAFLWQDGTMTDLWGVSGEAYDINERGQVVGWSYTALGEFHAFLWEKGTMTDLGTLGGTNSFARDINECGQVVGDSFTASGDEHAVLWTK